MKTVLRVGALLIILGVFGYTLFYLYQKSQKKPERYGTEQAFETVIVNKSVATGSIIPREEILLKPQISGIVKEIYVEAGDKVGINDPIAKIQVIPDLVSLNNAENRLRVARLNLKNAETDYNRNKKLVDQKVISASEFQQFELVLSSSQQELDAAQENLQIIKEGASNKKGMGSLNIVKATIAGMVLDVPIKVGNQVIESNNFNEGTSIGSIADMRDMIFEGKIDESEVGKIKEGMDILLTVGAIENKQFKAILEYIAPKGVEENGAIQFMIKAKVSLDSADFIRAGYSANADIVLAKTDSVVAIHESVVQYDGEQPFVEIATGEQIYERRDIKLGLSDGVNVQVLGGIEKTDQLKVWNKPL